jgi:hypothetical protein
MPLLGELSRLRVSADLFTRGALMSGRDRADIVVEISSARATAAPWSGGADVQVVVTPEGGAALRPSLPASSRALARAGELCQPRRAWVLFEL